LSKFRSVTSFSLATIIRTRLRLPDDNEQKLLAKRDQSEVQPNSAGWVAWKREPER
jgi:hypothetical protein